MTKVATCIYVLLVYCIKTLYQMLLIDIESGFFSHAETESEVVMLSATKQSAAGCSGTNENGAVLEIDRDHFGVF